ncbi:GM17058 [Drosophila sechellia]|uniref:GM17058 n=1 Tax=Drosophila sechellia TaxID=7238 RepID=B4I5L7_DROSE|nr:GM17058 [Drosophila sechellia]
MQQFKEHKELKLRDQKYHYRKERMKSTENEPKSYKHNYTTNQNQIREDYHCDHKTHSCEDRKSPLSHEHRAQYSFSKKCFNVNYHPAQNQQKPVIEHSCGDYLLYKNLNYEPDPSSKSEHCGVEGGCNNITPLRLNHHQKQKKDFFDYLNAAKAHCQAASERFQNKFPSCSKCSSSNESQSKPSSITVISAKSGDDLRAAVRSQIEVQEALNSFTLEVKDKREEVPSEEKRSNKPKKSRKITSHTQAEKVDSTAEKAQSGTPRVDDLELVDLSDSPIDVAIRKVDVIYSPSYADINKVIDPVIRNVQRMYLNTLKDEMSLIEYLVTVPELIKKAYRASTR